MADSRPEKRRVEFIESYWTGGEIGSDYQWNDCHGELIRCRDCKYRSKERTDRNMIWCDLHNFARPELYFCADGINDK